MGGIRLLEMRPSVKDVPTSAKHNETLGTPEYSRVLQSSPEFSKFNYFLLMYGCSKRKSHLSTDTITRCWLERIHIDLCGPIPNLLSGNKYFLLIIDEHTH